MLKLQFKITSADRRVYVNDEWISNGHWLVRKRAAMNDKHLKLVMKKWMHVLPGAYEGGEHLGPDVKLPEFERVVATTASGDGYVEASLLGRVVYGPSTLPEIRAVFLDGGEGIRAAISPRYAGLLTMGRAYIKDATSPVIIRDAAGEVAAVIMPRREEA